eukprot:gene19335-19738_t
MLRANSPYWQCVVAVKPSKSCKSAATHRSHRFAWLRQHLSRFVVPATMDTVIQYAPDSKQAEEYRQLANKVHNNSGQGTIPTPITMEELEDMLLDFGIMKTDEQALAELAAKEAAKAAAAAH